MPVAEVKLEIRTRGAKLWLALCLMVSPIVGRERASKWARRGIARITRYRVGGGRWHRFPPEAFE
jgi:hypothetical protein